MGGGGGPDGCRADPAVRPGPPPQAGHRGGLDRDFHAGGREHDRRHRLADDHRRSWRISAVQLGLCRAAADDGGDDPGLWPPCRPLRQEARVLCGTIIFLTGTTLCGFARSMPLLIAFRALQGVGSGAIQPISMTIIGDIYSPAERARIQGASSAVWGFAAIVGPALSAFLVEQVHWSVVFWVNLPIGLVSIVMFALFLNEKLERREQRIDFIGGALLIVGVGALMLALVQAVSLDGVTLTALVAFGVAALAWLLWHEHRTAQPMLPLSFWRRRV